MPEIDIFHEFLLSVGFFLILSIISLPFLKYFSDLLSHIGIYHTQRPLGERILYLYRSYIILSVPMIFAVFLILLQTNVIPNPIQAMIMAMGSYVIIPLTVRILSLTKWQPDICKIIRWGKVEVKEKQWIRRELYFERKERLVSTIFSIIFLAWFVYIIIFPVYIYFNNADFLINILKQISTSPQVVFWFVISFFVLPFLYVIIGELILFITGRNEYLQTPA